jgi:hypothetical protein
LADLAKPELIEELAAAERRVAALLQAMARAP